MMAKIKLKKPATTIELDLDEDSIEAAGYVKERTGKWILFYDENWNGHGGYKCSVCENGYSFGAYHEANEFKFCPACGARMENAQ